MGYGISCIFHTGQHKLQRQRVRHRELAVPVDSSSIPYGCAARRDGRGALVKAASFTWDHTSAAPVSQTQAAKSLPLALQLEVLPHKPETPRPEPPMVPP